MLHPLAYHRFVLEGRIAPSTFWMPVRDDRIMAARLTTVPPSPPAYLAGVGAALIPWSPIRG